MASQPEYLLASLAFLLLIVLPIMQILTGQLLYVHQIASTESRIHNLQEVAHLLLYYPGLPENWGSVPEVPQALGLALANRDCWLDAQKLFRLTSKSEYEINYSVFAGLLSLHERGVDIRLVLRPPFNLSLSQNGTHIEIRTARWSGLPLPNVRVHLVMFDAFLNEIENSTVYTDGYGRAAVSKPPDCAVVLAGAYYSGLFAPAMLAITVSDDPTVKLHIEEDVSLRITVFTKRRMLIFIRGVLVFFDARVTTHVTYSAISFSSSISLNIPGRGFLFVLLYVFTGLRRHYVFVPYPPLFGYFDVYPAYGANITSSFSYSETVVVRGEIFEVVLSC